MSITLNGSTGITTPTYGGSVPAEYITPVTGFKNIIINGNMQIAQRGTTATGITTSGYNTVDRMLEVVFNAGTWDITQDTDVPTGQGFSNSLKMQCTSSLSLPADALLCIDTRIEGQNLQQLNYGTPNATPITLSFWVKSNKIGTQTFVLQNVESVGKAISKTYTVDSANTWEKKTITIEGDASAAIVNTNGLGFVVRWVFAAGTNFSSGTLNTSWATLVVANMVSPSNIDLADTVGNYINITGVQLEKGDTATSFDYRPYGTELALCQRYYQVISVRVPTTAEGAALSGYILPVTPRATPTVSGGGAGFSASISPTGTYLQSQTAADFNNLEFSSEL